MPQVLGSLPAHLSVLRPFWQRPAVVNFIANQLAVLLGGMSRRRRNALFYRVGTSLPCAALLAFAGTQPWPGALLPM